MAHENDHSEHTPITSPARFDNNNTPIIPWDPYPEYIHDSELDALEATLGSGYVGSYGTLAERLDAIEVIQNNDDAAAIAAINAELGVDPSGAYATVLARLDAMTNNISSAQATADTALNNTGSSAITALDDRITALETESGSNPSGTFATIKDRLDNMEVRLGDSPVFWGPTAPSGPADGTVWFDTSGV